jgi:hypothetical protein
VSKPDYRRKRIAALNIPIYENFKKFYFHDLLLCLCIARFENEFDVTRGYQLKRKARILKELKVKLNDDPDFDEESRKSFVKKAEKNLSAEQLLKKDCATQSLSKLIIDMMRMGEV